MLKDLRLSVDAVTTWENINYCLLGKVLCFNLSDTKKSLFSDAYVQVNIEVVILKLLGI